MKSSLKFKLSLNLKNSCKKLFQKEEIERIN